MLPRQPSRETLPRLWLMTDERMGGALWPALARLPRGAGVVFRHHATPAAERRALLGVIERRCRRRGLLLVVAGADAPPGMPAHGGRGALTRPAHSQTEAIAAVRAGARLIFVSPVFATTSHPGARALGPLRAAAIGRGLPVLRIALGGMDAGRFRRLRGLGFAGWAAIDAWMARAEPTPGRPDQKRKAVPTYTA